MPAASPAVALPQPMSAVSPITDIIAEARNGRLFILVDHEDRENEGDLVVPGQMATPAAINFMATNARGLICLALPPERTEALGLRVLSPKNRTRIDTAFTVSIEAREGVTTGISVHDRAHTVAVAIDPERGADDISTPGHVFPLRAREGGVLSRAGHTEAAVDIARLAGLNPSAVICEIMKEDGSMARLPDLIPFAEQHNLRIGTIADLIAHRLQTETIVDQVITQSYESPSGHRWTLHVFCDRIAGEEHIALTYGPVEPDRPVLVRVHAINVLDDLLGFDSMRDRGLPAVMAKVEAAGAGALILVCGNHPNSISERLRGPAPNPAEPQTLRQYGVGAGILRTLGIREMVLLTNSPPPRMAGIEGYGLHLAGIEQFGVEE